MTVDFKLLRRTLMLTIFSDFRKKSTALPIFIILLNYAILISTVVWTFFNPTSLAVVFLIPINGLAIGLLFLVGHDSCHLAFFKNPLLNQIFGRIVFFPSMISFSGWEIGHNFYHHGFTCIKTHDYSWVPLSVHEYSMLNSFSKFVYRFQRSYLGWGLYWMKEIWWKKMFFPSKMEVKEANFKLHFESLLNALYPAIFIFSALQLSPTKSVSKEGILFLCFGLIFPWMIWCWLAGMVTFIQHTNLNVKWYPDAKNWDPTKAAIESTVYVEANKFVDFLFHRVLLHNSHHIDTKIPMYELKSAQGELMKVLSSQSIPVSRVKFNYWDVIKNTSTCNIYDFEKLQWQKF